MRRYLAVVLFGVGLAGCDSAGPLETEQTLEVQAGLVPGTGNPAIDALLQSFNNEVVACATNGELDSRTASTLALLTSILRFTPTPEQKLDALVGALLIQIENAQRKGGVSPGCAESLTAILQSIPQ